MYAYTILDQIRKQVAARPESLREARERRDRVLRTASSFNGVLRTYKAGSLATRFTNRPVSDADAGVVMDRRTLPDLGPDGEGELPAELVNKIRLHIRPQLAAQYSNVRVERMKRGLLIRFGQLLTSGEDPSVDLVVALNRAVDDALWIPNLDKNRWDPSHPEKHVQLFTSSTEKHRRTRRHVVRLAKAQVQQFDKPHLCSFNIAALAWECIQSAERIDLALLRFFEYSATELAKHFTKDPAGVSDSIRVDDRELAVKRLRRTADGLRLAIDAGNNEDKVREVLATQGVFWKLLQPQNDNRNNGVLHGSHTNNVVEAVRTGGIVSVAASGTLATGKSSRGATPLKLTRAYGGFRAYG
ncbi:MAG: hypothetical protein OXI96_03505 [Acidimicrobiaceae bacterium]|nr:hypothetical protein [Acidimicrobiaceae bacterium]